MSKRIVIRREAVTRTVTRRAGIPGKSAYQSYLDTTEDDPPMTEEEWSAGGGGTGTVTWSSISGKPATFPPSVHGHDWSEITSKPTTFPPGTHAHGWSEITGKPSTFPPTIGSGEGDAVAGNDERLSDARTPTAHTHVSSDVTDATITPVYGKLRTWNAVYSVAFTSDTQGAKAADFFNGSLEANLDGGTVSFVYDSDGGNWVLTYSAQLESATLPGNADDDPFLLDWTGANSLGVYAITITAYDVSEVTISTYGIGKPGEGAFLSIGTSPDNDISAGGHSHTPASIGAAPAVHGHTASQISDSTAAGRALLTAADAAAQRTAMGAEPTLAQLVDANIVTGSSTTPGKVSPAQLKLAAQTWGGGGGSTTRDPAKFVAIECDFLSISGFVISAVGFVNFVAFGNGVITFIAGESSHIGVVSLIDGTTANSGYRIITESNAFLLAGGEESTFIFSPRDQRATTEVRLGFQDSLTTGAVTDGCYLKIVGNGAGGMTVSGICRSNSSETSTGTTGTITNSSWYRGTIVLNSAGTLATFTIKTDAGATVWTDTVATNIPTGAGRQTGWGIWALESTTDSGASMMYLDYCKLEITRTLTR